MWLIRVACISRRTPLQAGVFAQLVSWVLTYRLMAHVGIVQVAVKYASRVLYVLCALSATIRQLGAVVSVPLGARYVYPLPPVSVVPLPSPLGSLVRLLVCLLLPWPWSDFLALGAIYLASHASSGMTAVLAVGSQTIEYS